MGKYLIPRGSQRPRYFPAYLYPQVVFMYSYQRALFSHVYFLQSQKKVPRIESDTSQDQTSTLMPLVDVKPENNMAVQSVENDETPTISIAQTNNDQEHVIEKDSPLVGIPLTERPASDVVENNDHHMEVPSTLTEVEAVFSTSNGEPGNENASDVPKEHPFLSLPAEKVEIFDEDIPNDASQSFKSRDTNVTLKIDLERSQLVSTDVHGNSDTQQKDADIKVEPLIDKKRQQELEVDDSQMKVQDQLDEVKVIRMVRVRGLHFVRSNFLLSYTPAIKSFC